MNNEINNERLQQLFGLFEAQQQEPFITYAIATELKKINQPAQAIEWYQKTLEIDPNYLAAFYHLAQTQEQLELTEAARLSYQRGIVVAENRKDLKTLAELKNALMNLELMD